MLRYFISLFILCLFSLPVFASDNKIIIFQGEEDSPQSLPAIILAAMEQPDFIELPLVLTKDNIPVVYNDIFLHPKTNAAAIFPLRKRPDGKYYFIDFLWSEIQQLSFDSPIDDEVFSGRLTSYDEAVRMIELISKKQNREVRVLPVIKYPWFFSNEGKDISTAILQKTIAHAGTAENAIFLKCYDPEELQRIHKKILPGLPVEVKLIQGIDVENGPETMRKKNGSWVSYDYDWIFTRLGARVLSGYAYGLFHISPDVTDEGTLVQSIEDSHALGMKVFTGMGADQSSSSPETQFEAILFTMNIDGIALKAPARLRNFLKEKGVPVPDKTAENDAAAILSDPEALSRRLKQIQ